MTASKTTRPVKDGLLNPFPYGFQDESGSGAGPFNPLHASLDASGALVNPATRENQASILAAMLATLPRSIASNAPRVATSGTLAAVNDAVTLGVDGMNTIMVQAAAGSWTGTALFEASVDSGQTWVAVNMVPYAGGPPAAGPAPGTLWEVACGGLTQIRVRASTAIAGGPAAVTIAAAHGLKSIRVGAPGGNPLPTQPNHAASGKAPVTGTFSATGQSSAFAPIGGRGFNISLWGSFAAGVQAERSFDAGANWLPVTAAGTQLLKWTAPASEQWSEDETPVLYRLNCTTWSNGTVNYRVSQ